MRAAIYTRVSTKDADDSNSRQTTENQILQLEAFAATQGWDIILRYEDRKSGKNADREQFQQMFEDASQRKFDVLLFWALDRFSREGVLPTLQHLQRLGSYGVVFKSFTQPYLDTTGMFRDAVIAILAAVAQQERLLMSERIKAGIERAVAKGQKMGPGFKKLNEQAIIELAGQGKGSNAIAKALKQSEATIRRRMKKLGVYRPQMASEYHPPKHETENPHY